MNKRYRLAFFGTSDKTAPLLDALSEKFEIVLCVTKSDTLVGRHQEQRQTGVKKWAKEHDTRFSEVESLKSENLAGVIEHLRYSNPDIILVCDFSMIIPQKLLDTFPDKFLNVHFSLLPQYRGAAPVQHAILHGETRTGITLQKLTYKMDTGDIITQHGYTMDSFSTAGEVLADLFSIATEVIPTDLLDYLENRHSPTPQTETLATYTWSRTNPKTTLIQKADARIDWQSSILEIYNLVRAYNPWPIAWTTLAEVARNDKLGTQGKKLKKEDLGNLIFKIHSTKLEDTHLQPETVQVEGKNKISWESFKNGYLE